MKHTLVFLFIVIFSNRGIAQHTFLPDSLQLYDVIGETNLPLKFFYKQSVLVMIFVVADCPIVDIYIDKITDLFNNYNKKGTKFLLVNSTSQSFREASVLPAIRKHAQDIPYELLYLADTIQTIRTILDISVAPEVVILTSVKGGFSKVYQGAIDNTPMSEASTSKRYIESVLEHIRNQTPILNNYVRPIGCRIK